MKKESLLTRESLEVAKLHMLQIFKAQKELRNLFTDYSWKGLVNTLGDYGELIGVVHYSLKKAGKGSKGYDALFNGKRVQIKTIMHSKQIGFRGDKKEIDMVLVLKINEHDASWEEIYWGSFEGFYSNGISFSARDNKSMMSLSKLKSKKL